MTSTTRSTRLVPLLSALAIVAATALPRAEAQNAGRPRSPNDTLKSVEVGPDHKVTLRIYAPKASEVSVGGDFGAGGKLTKDEQGVWSLTTEPLTPDYYTYMFNVDGVRTADPKNPMVKPGLSGVDSMLFVPGPEAEFESDRDIPHGEVRAAWYPSVVVEGQRRLHIYTPPGYEGGSEKYPVFYLLHGAGDDDLGWGTIGRAGIILDNLIAEKKARPMIVVMPNGSIPRPTNLPRATPGTPPSAEFRTAMASLMNKFNDELLKQIIPFVEKTYRVLPGRENRALAGLSMGGAQTLRVITTAPEEFAHVGIWSSGLFGSNVEEWEKQNPDFLSKVETFNHGVKLFSISVGDKDFVMSSHKAMVEALSKHGVKHEVHTSGGGHTWINWRHYLADFAPRLFRD